MGAVATADEARVLVYKTLMPGDITIETADLSGLSLLAVVEGDDAAVYADAALDTVGRHRAMERLRAHLAPQPTPWPRQVLLVRLCGADGPTCVSSGAVGIDTKLEGDADGAGGQAGA